MSDSKAGICARFSQNTWHDSKIIQLHVVKDLENDRYDLLLDLNMIVGYSEGKHERARKTGRFTNCRVIKADLDLLGMLLCGGDLAVRCVTRMRSSLRERVETWPAILICLTSAINWRAASVSTSI